MLTSLRLITSSGVRRYSGTRLNARRKSSGRDVQRHEQPMPREQPLVRVDDERVARPPRPARAVARDRPTPSPRTPRRRAATRLPCARAISATGSDRRRRRRADGRDDRARIARVEQVGAHAVRVVDGHAPQLELEHARRLVDRRVRVLAADDDAAVGHRRARRGERGQRRDRRGVLDVPVPLRAEGRAARPSQRRRPLLQLGERRRRAPEDPDLVQRDRQQLRQDRRLRRRCSRSTRRSADAASA